METMNSESIKVNKIKMTKSQIETFELVDNQGGQIVYYEYIEMEEGDYSFREYENE